MRHHSQDLASAEELMIISEGTKDIDMSSRNPSILPLKMPAFGGGNLRGEKRYGSSIMPVITAKQVVVN